MSHFFYRIESSGLPVLMEVSPSVNYGHIIHMLVKKKGHIGVFVPTACVLTTVLIRLCISYSSPEVRMQDGSHFKFVYENHEKA